jgi:hypothetical protein
LEKSKSPKAGEKGVYKEGFKAMAGLAGFLIGGVTFLVGFLVLITLFWTIIGAFLGFGAIVAGGLIIAVTLPKVKAECPACENSQKIVSGSKSFKCDTCKQVVVVKWIEKEKETNKNVGGN